MAVAWLWVADMDGCWSSSNRTQDWTCEVNTAGGPRELSRWGSRTRGRRRLNSGGDLGSVLLLGGAGELRQGRACWAP